MSAPQSREKILVVDDEGSMREFLEIMLLKEGYEVHSAEDGQSALDMIRRERYDLVITDIRMKPVDGLEVLRHCKAMAPGTVVIMISAFASTETAVTAMKEGAYDYLPKPFKIDEMRTVIRDALATRHGGAPRREPAQGPFHLGFFIGESAGMRKIYALIERVAAADSNVLITGESGTGKELVAKAIHHRSARRDFPMVVVNCGGVPESLIESELFGYRKGAFTGATSTHKGLVESAQGGTLFLDEIGELSPTLQVKLLRLAQEKTVRMIGGTEDVPVNVRIVSATHRDLERMVIDNTFREDLYYRLNVIHLHMPALRERREDIPVLAEYFLDKFRSKLGKDVRKISSYAMDILMNYNFPGNVRELENILERSVALETSSIVLPDSLTLSAHKKALEHPGTAPEHRLTEGFNLDRYLADIEKDLLTQALEDAQGVKLKAADLLGISFRSLRYRLAKYGMAIDEEPIGPGH
jgi:two-component system response regulator PilR (NtrC family)